MLRFARTIRHFPVSKLAHRVRLNLLRRLSRSRNLPASFWAKTAKWPLFESFSRWEFSQKNSGSKLPWNTISLLNQCVSLPDDAETLDEFLNSGSALWRENAGYLEYLLPLVWIDDKASQAERRTYLESFLKQWLTVSFATRTWSTYGVARRIITQAQLTPAIEALPAEGQKQFWQCFYEESVFLHNFLEWDIEGNHLIKNLLALLYASIVFNSHPATQSRAQHWWKTLDQHLVPVFESQVLEDGLHFERTPMYHLWVLSDLLDCIVLLKQHRPEFNGEPLEALAHKMLLAMENLLHTNGQIPLFGDSSLPQTPNPRHLMQYAQRHLKSYAPGSTLQNNTHCFKEGGFLVLRNETPARSLVMKYGNFAPKSLPAHSHCDIGSFELVIEDQPFIVDSGTGDYETSIVREYFRGSGAHNTLWVPGSDQAEVWGSFRVAEYPSKVAHELAQDDSGLQLSLCYSNYNDTYEHQRRLYAIGNTFWVLQDWVMHLHPADTPVYSLLHIHPDRNIRLIDNRIYEIDDKLLIVPYGMKQLGWSDHSPWQSDAKSNTPKQSNLNLYSEGFHQSKPGQLLWQAPKGRDCFARVLVPYPYADQKPECSSLGEGLQIHLPHLGQTWALTWESDGLKIWQADHVRS